MDIFLLAIASIFMGFWFYEITNKMESIKILIPFLIGFVITQIIIQCSTFLNE